MIQRYSSRRSPLKDFLATQLQGARRYDRIAGFFSFSLLEVAGEALERMTPEGGEAYVRVVRNSCLNLLDVQTALAAKWGMHREWRASLPAEIGAPMKARLQRLYDFLQNGLLKVKVLPDEAFGLIHGKAGVMTRTDGGANQTRLKPPGEIKGRDLSGEGFARSLRRQILFAVYKTAQEDDLRSGLDYLKQAIPNYWDRRQTIIALLTYLSQKPSQAMVHWKKDVEAAHLLLGTVDGDGI
jgi:hypothetical protein